MRWGLIQVALLDSFNASAAGLYALSENYLYTREAFATYLSHLEPGGILAITRWTRVPPRDSLKVFATAIDALRRSGVSDPANHLLMIRSWNTSTLLARNEPFGSRDIERLQAFCRERWFDLVHYPGMDAALANRYNQLPEPWYFGGAQALLGPQRDAYEKGYKFDITPATDDRPYFSRFLKLHTLPELLALKERGGLPLLEWGYLVLIATLLLALSASFLLVLLPLSLRRGDGAARGVQWRYVGYFTAVGTAFMFIEIAFIQKFILFLHHPLYAVSVVLCAFLVFAGLGSLASSRWRGRRPALLLVTGIGILAVLYALLLPDLFSALAAAPGAVKIVVSAVLIAPLAFLMGMPFPLGLNAVAGHAPAWIPWAWGVNGCASVVSAIMAMLLAIHLGFAMVVYLAVALYLLAGWLFNTREQT
jgi:hypothetical protein